MANETLPKALGSEQDVRDIALMLVRLCGEIHEALRRSTCGKEENTSTLPYALLTEEYALRSRANTLLIEAKRFARQDLSCPQQNILDTLQATHARFETVTSLQQLADLINCVMLFANSLMSRNGKVTMYLLDELNQTVHANKFG
ncbi:hypothetical protein [Duganella fentianensis]|uniref:hypothetical protein n=1 Tax=Duganella fentianensis TaxID=2692177 RepID=UPI0032B0F1CD